MSASCEAGSHSSDSPISSSISWPEYGEMLLSYHIGAGG